MQSMIANQKEEKCFYFGVEHDNIMSITI